MALADLLVVMNQGRIEDHGPPDRVYLRPRTRFTATFLGDSNLIEGRVVAAGNGWSDVGTPLGGVRLAGSGPRAHGDAGSGPSRSSTARLRETCGASARLSSREAMFLGSHWRVVAEPCLRASA